MIAYVMQEGQIGWLRPLSESFVGICNDCKVDSDKTPLFHTNVYPYNQHCFTCKVELVKGGDAWPELFNGTRP